MLSWEASRDELVDSLKRAARGGSPCSPDVAEALLRRVRENPRGKLATVKNHVHSILESSGSTAVVKPL